MDNIITPLRGDEGGGTVPIWGGGLRRRGVSTPTKSTRCGLWCDIAVLRGSKVV